MVNSLTEVDIKSRGVPVLDLFLAQEAERLRKQTGAVEKVEEQCHPLNGLNFSQVRWSGVQGARLAPELDIAAETAWAGVRGKCFLPRGLCLLPAAHAFACILRRIC